MVHGVKRAATIEDFLAIDEVLRHHEFFAGERVIVEKASPSGAHGGAQASVVSVVGPRYHRRGGGRGGPGGWWIATEVEVLFPGGDVLRPDILGWRRDRVAARPTETIVKAVPDWVCEILSPSNASVDTVKKQRIYHMAKVGHFWIVDPRDATLTVMRWSEPGYTTVLCAERGETVHAEPFEVAEIVVGTLFGDDPPEE
jgi:Uma2 family endonuclease